MKIRQTVRHLAARKALETPVVGSRVHDRLVDLHTDIFLDKAEEGRSEERRAHLDALFDGTVDAYLAALQEGRTEAEAREITHVMANFDFYNHGWTEMMEFPADEIETHRDRYGDFFERHGVTIDDPLGDFADGELPEAPPTLGKLEDPEHPHAEGGFADDLYVEGPDGDVASGDADVAGTEAAGTPGTANDADATAGDASASGERAATDADGSADGGD